MSLFWVWRSSRYLASVCTEDVCRQVRQTPACPRAYGTYGGTQFLWRMCSSWHSSIPQACVWAERQDFSWEKTGLPLASIRLHGPCGTLPTGKSSYMLARGRNARTFGKFCPWPLRSAVPSSSASHLSRFWKSDSSCGCSAYGNLLLTSPSQRAPCGMCWEPAGEQGGQTQADNAPSGYPPGILGITDLLSLQCTRITLFHSVTVISSTYASELQQPFFSRWFF